MLRRWYLQLIVLLLAFIVLNKVHAYYEEVDNEGDDNYKGESYSEHYECDDCSEDYEDLQDIKDLKEIIRLLGPKEISKKDVTSNGLIPNGISRIDGQSLILPQTTNFNCLNRGLSNAYRRFNAIIFGDFHTFGDGQSAGPLAVKGNFTTVNYSVNPDVGSDCSDHKSLDAYAFIVNGYTSAKLLTLNGDSFINGDRSSMTQLDEIGWSCSIIEGKGTGLVDFNALEVEANTYNSLYRDQPPTLQLLEDGSLKRLADSDQGIEYLTFNACEDRSTCVKIAEGQMSDPTQIFFDGVDWTGVQGDLLPDNSMTYVFNIPVIENTVINITTNLPSRGFNGCRIIYNFYPVKKDTGEYNPSGVFTVIRSSPHRLYGLVLAPRGRIIEGASGTFAGQIIALSYTWEASDTPQTIYNYNYMSGNCFYFDGCIPDSPKIVTTTASATTTITEGIKTTTQRSTTTINVEVTQTATSTLRTGGFDTVTLVTNHFTTIKKCGPANLYTYDFHHIHEEEEDHHDDFEKKWHHKKYDEEVEEEDDCDDHYYE